MKLFLIDGHALIFKMYYAFLGRPMVNSKGEDTSIIFGFTKYLLELIQKEQPTHMAVSFDPPGGTFRNRMYPEYKANRPETPALIVQALEPLSRIVRSMGIPVVMVSDYEADDVIGTLARKFSSPQMDVYMVTPDKDYGQLVADHVFQYKPGKGGGDNEILSQAQICEKYGISSTLQVIDMLAICGDSADNVPGVSGVGPVGASKLLQKYGSVEGIYEHLSELTPKQQEAFRNAQGHMALSKQLVTIDTEVPVEVGEEELRLSSELDGGLLSIIKEYEMPSLERTIKSLWTVRAEGVDEKKDGGTLVYQQSSADELCSLIKKVGRMSFVLSSEDVYVACEGKVAVDKARIFADVLVDKQIEKIGYDIKSSIKALYDMGIGIEGHFLDIQLMHYVLNPERNHHLDAIVREVLGVEIEESADSVVAPTLFDDPQDFQSSDSLFRSAQALWETAPKLQGIPFAGARGVRRYRRTFDTGTCTDGKSGREDRCERTQRIRVFAQGENG